MINDFRINNLLGHKTPKDYYRLLFIADLLAYYCEQRFQK